MVVYFENFRTSRSDNQYKNFNFDTEIYWERVEKSPPLPADLRELSNQISKTLRIIKQLYLDCAAPDEKLFSARFTELFRIAVIGLRGEQPDTETSKSDLDQLQTQIVSDADPKRRVALRQYILLTLAFTIPTVLSGFLFYILWKLAYVPSWATAQPPINDKIPGVVSDVYLVFIVISWITAGAAFGNFLMFIFRSSEVQFATILNFNEFRWKPLESFVYIITAALGLGLTLWFNILQLGVFGVLLNDFVQHDPSKPAQPAIAIVVGLTTAFGFTAVREILKQIQVSRRE